MHRRDYILIAKVLRNNKQEAIETGIFSKEAIEKITNDFCAALKEENSSFNETKFRDYIKKGE
jgi:hypothetical protein